MGKFWVKVRFKSCFEFNFYRLPAFFFWELLVFDSIIQLRVCVGGVGCSNWRTCRPSLKLAWTATVLDARFALSILKKFQCDKCSEIPKNDKLKLFLFFPLFYFFWQEGQRLQIICCPKRISLVIPMALVEI